MRRLVSFRWRTVYFLVRFKSFSSLMKLQKWAVLSLEKILKKISCVKYGILNILSSNSQLRSTNLQYGFFIIMFSEKEAIKFHQYIKKNFFEKKLDNLYLSLISLHFLLILSQWSECANGSRVLAFARAQMPGARAFSRLSFFFSALFFVFFRCLWVTLSNFVAMFFTSRPFRGRPAEIGLYQVGVSVTRRGMTKEAE